MGVLKITALKNKPNNNSTDDVFITHGIIAGLVSPDRKYLVKYLTKSQSPKGVREEGVFYIKGKDLTQEQIMKLFVDGELSYEQNCKYQLDLISHSSQEARINIAHFGAQWIADMHAELEDSNDVHLPNSLTILDRLNFIVDVYKDQIDFALTTKYLGAKQMVKRNQKEVLRIFRNIKLD